MSDDFDEALEAIFEERAAGFGADLKAMLRSLFEEGTKVGRHQERMVAAELRNRVAQMVQGDELLERLPPNENFTVADVRRAIRSLDRALPNVVDINRGLDWGSQAKSDLRVVKARSKDLTQQALEMSRQLYTNFSDSTKYIVHDSIMWEAYPGDTQSSKPPK